VDAISAEHAGEDLHNQGLAVQKLLSHPDDQEPNPNANQITARAPRHCTDIVKKTQVISKLKNQAAHSRNPKE